MSYTLICPPLGSAQRSPRGAGLALKFLVQIIACAEKKIRADHSRLALLEKDYDEVAADSVEGDDEEEDGGDM